MSWLKWPIQIVLMLTVIGYVSVYGWEEIADSNYGHFKYLQSHEKRLKREFQLKSDKANNLPGYQKQAIALEKELVGKRDIMLHFSNVDNIERWCVQLSNISDTKIDCEIVKRRDNEFYYEQQVDLTLILKEETLNSLLVTLTSDQTINLDTVFWRNILVDRNKQPGYLNFKANLSFIYWREEDDL